MALPQLNDARSARSGGTHACEACDVGAWTWVVREQDDELSLVVGPSEPIVCPR